MTLCKVVGSVTSTIKHQSLAGRKLLLCTPLSPETGKAGAKPRSVVAIDTVQAGVGDIVLVIDEGNAARKILSDSSAPVRTVVAAVVDDFGVERV
jgi:ethanolamine utilization protein EutN